MELLVIISHPRVSVRPAQAMAGELAGVYDRVYESQSEQKYLQMPHASVVLLKWPPAGLGWSHWQEVNGGTLITAGQPLLYCPPGGVSSMLTPQRLAEFIRGRGDDEGGEPSGELRYCGGYFAAVCVDAGRRVRLINNYLGEVPLYRADHGGVTVWSNKAAVAAMLAGLEAALDERAATEFVLLAHSLEDRTLWRGVEVEPAGTCITVTQQGHQRQGYLKLPGAYFSHRMGRQETAVSVVESLGPLVVALKDSSQSVRLHLSGGQDSRAVAAVCRHHGFKPICITHNTPNAEVASARRVARFLGLKYQTVEGQVPGWELFTQRACQSTWQSDGMTSLKYLAGLYDLEFIRQQGYLPMEGLGGEFGRGYYFDSDEAYRYLAEGRFDGFYKKALGDRQRYWPRGAAAQRVLETIEGILERAREGGLNAFEATTWFYVNQRVRLWGSARRNTGWQWVIEPLKMPCWTYPAMSASPEDQRHDRLIQAVIEAAWPGTTGVPTVPQLAYQARRRRVASNRIVRTAMKFYDRLRGPEPDSWQTRTLKAMRMQMLEQMRRMGEFLEPVVSVEAAQQWLEPPDWSYSQTELFWHTLTLAFWAQEFLSKGRVIQPCRLTGEAGGGGGVVHGPPPRWAGNRDG